MMKNAVAETIRSAVFTPRGFKDQAALVESIAYSCRGKRTAMITGNYTVKEGPDTLESDPRLLGHEMLLTIELAGRVYGRCVELGIEPPAIVLVPNDIAPGIFQSNEEERAFKASYKVPGEITAVLSAHGLTREPLYFFLRDFAKSTKSIKSWAKMVRKQVREDKEKLIVMFESFAQNLASRALARGKIMHENEIGDGTGGVKQILAPATVKDSFSGEAMLTNTAVSVIQPNGAPFCSFLAATLFREFEALGFGQMVNTFVMQEYPCVDKAAAAYKYMYEGKMTIRNIYLEGTTVEVDNTIG
jgi:hypothetical protein